MSNQPGNESNNSPGKEEEEQASSPVKGPLLLSERPTLLGGSGVNHPSTNHKVTGRQIGRRKRVLKLSLILFTPMFFIVQWILQAVLHPQPESQLAPRGYVSVSGYSQISLPPQSSVAIPSELPLRTSGRPHKLISVLKPSSLPGSGATYSPESRSPFALSHDGKLLATGLAPSGVGVWNTSTGTLVQRFEVDLRGGSSLLFTPNGSTLIAYCEDVAVQLWNVRTGKMQWHLDIPNAGQVRIALSPDGKILAMAKPFGNGKNYEVKLWNILTGELASTASQKEAAVSALAFSPDGARLVATEVEWPQFDSEIVIWTLQSNEPPIRRFETFARSKSVVFSPDGKALVTGATILERPPLHSEQPVPPDGCCFFGEVVIRNPLTAAPRRKIRCLSCDPEVSFSYEHQRVAVLEPGQFVEVFDLDGRRRDMFDPSALCVRPPYIAGFDATLNLLSTQECNSDSLTISRVPFR